ncbi:MAG: DUF2460 domain-containing protein [Candidatus Thorarchaeota archaeon]|jgi:uncharacterized protein (TIGR02217 family)
MIDVVINDLVGDAAYGTFGVQGPRRKTFDWRTDVVTFDSGVEQRNQIMSRPLRHFFLNWHYMDLAARNKLVELVNRAKGRYETFKYKDNLDFACTVAECSVTAAGGETTTQLVKEYYQGETESWTENKTLIVANSQTVWIDAAEKTEGQEYTLNDNTGVIDWTGGAAPNGALVLGEVVTALYEFYFLVRFIEDEHLDVEHYQDFWGSEVHLIEVLL